MITHHDRARAFALQAKADLQSRAILAADSSLPDCEHLHCLQMACEKLCKAYLYAHGSATRSIEATHACIGGPLPIIIRQILARNKTARGNLQRLLSGQVQKFAREIECLHPSVDDNGRRPDNCEYPWTDASGTLRVPADHGFTSLQFLDEPFGRTFLKMVEDAVEELF